MEKPKKRLPENPEVLKPASNAYDFRVYNMDENGKPNKVYHPHDSVATVVINQINLVRLMLKEEPVISSFEQIAIQFCRQRPNAWFLQKEQPEVATNEQEPGTATPKQKPKTATDEEAKVATHVFLHPLQAEWPFMVVSEKLKNPVCTAFTGRGEWHGDFDVSEQYIALNARVSET